jgi:hypothetical protein
VEEVFAWPQLWTGTTQDPQNKGLDDGQTQENQKTVGDRVVKPETVVQGVGSVELERDWEVEKC